MLPPCPKAMTAGGATKQSAAKTAIAIATRKPSPVRSALIRYSSLVAGAGPGKLATDQKTRYHPCISPQLVSQPRMTIANPPPARALVADIGGTNARFAVADLATLALSEI